MKSGLDEVSKVDFGKLGTWEDRGEYELIVPPYSDFDGLCNTIGYQMNIDVFIGGNFEEFEFGVVE